MKIQKTCNQQNFTAKVSIIDAGFNQMNYFAKPELKKLQDAAKKVGTHADTITLMVDNIGSNNGNTYHFGGMITATEFYLNGSITALLYKSKRPGVPDIVENATHYAKTAKADYNDAFFNRFAQGMCERALELIRKIAEAAKK